MKLKVLRVKNCDNGYIVSFERGHFAIVYEVSKEYAKWYNLVLNFTFGERHNQDVWIEVSAADILASKKINESAEFKITTEYRQRDFLPEIGIGPEINRKDTN